jgi:hypothetical protein
MMSLDRRSRIQRELDRLYIDCKYSAQVHFEAAKSAELFGKLLVFIPAVVAAAASLLVALGQDRSLGGIGALAAAIAATATLLGPERKAPNYRQSARSYTRIRHAVRLERELLDESADLNAAERRLRKLRDDYAETLAIDEPTANRFYRRADKRIGAGVLDYGAIDDRSQPPNYR